VPEKMPGKLLFYKFVMASSALVFIFYTSSYDQSEIEGHESLNIKNSLAL